MKYKIIADASIPHLKPLFEPSFILELYHNEEELRSLLPDQDILICRSTLMVNEALLKATTLKCIATVSSGTNHINETYLRQKHIRLIDAKGSNATAVADYVLSVIAYLDLQDYIKGKYAGIIGLGCVGKEVLKRLKCLDFEISIFDPYVDLESSLNALINCNLICIHPNLHELTPYPSKNLLNTAFLNQLKPATTIINASRGSILNENALLKMVNPMTYCTDVYENEPRVNRQIIEYATLCTPHIAGHTIEAKNLGIIQVCRAIYQQFQLKAPSFHFLKEQSIPLSTEQLQMNHWQEFILSLYNPSAETNALKNCNNLGITFQEMRKLHLRHSFACFAEEAQNKFKFLLD